MTFVIQYLRGCRLIFFKELLFVGVFVAVFYLYRLPMAAVLYPAGLCLLIGCVFEGSAICRAYQKHQKLTRLQFQHRTTIQEALVGKEMAEEEDYRQLVLELCGELQTQEERWMESYQEMVDYFTIWVHQIKTPIASMRLRLEAEDSGQARRLTSDLLHIEQYVGMVLTYFRLGAESTDYVFDRVSLDRVVRENIRKLRGDFIIKKLNLEYTTIQEVVISDEKWLSFVIEQVLSNALKYTNEGTVAVFSEEPGVLCIRDTGIGIAPEDIPRIFEKGYTGGNGRMDKRASGLGLYLCRQICERLGVRISVSSQVEIGTVVRMDLSQSLQKC